MIEAEKFSAVAAVVQEYLDCLYDYDAQSFSRVFHPQARYTCATGGHWVHLDMVQYRALVEARPTPRSQQHPRSDEVIAIEFAGTAAASARLACSIPGKSFIDLLTLVYLDGRWQIISKVFDYQARD